MDLQSRRVLITGSSRGLGRAIALALAQHGGKIGVNYMRNAEAAEEVARQIRQRGGEALLLPGDVADKAQAERVVADFCNHFDGIDVLINNAGAGMNGTVMTLSDEDWQRTLDVHLNGAFYCTRAVVPHMTQRRFGKILVMSSIAGLRGVPNLMAYAVVKAGLMAFTRCTAMDLSEYGIAVNAICPGLIDTDFHAMTPPERRAHNINNRVPLHRYGTAEEVAQAALFLLQNDYITGETLTIDGGLSMRVV